MNRATTQILAGLLFATVGLIPGPDGIAPDSSCLQQMLGGDDSEGVLRECDTFPGTCTQHYEAVSVCGDVWYECTTAACGAGTQAPCPAPNELCSNDHFKSCLDPDTTNCNIAAVTHDCGQVRRGACTILVYNGPGDPDCPDGKNFKCTTTACGSLGGFIDCEDISACDN